MGTAILLLLTLNVSPSIEKAVFDVDAVETIAIFS
jgi:hypothetical protein